jgi:hypothetical protein
LDDIKTKVFIRLSSAAIVNSVGTIAAQCEGFSISLELVGGLHKLARKSHSAEDDKAKQIEDLYKKSLHREERFLALGLNAARQAWLSFARFIH